MAPGHVAVWAALVKRIVAVTCAPLTLTLAITIASTSASGCGGPTLDVGTPFTVAHVGPSHGATAIAVDTDVRVGFSDAIDRESARTNISLAVGDDEVERSTLFFEDDTLLVLVPVRTLPNATVVTLTIGADMQSAAGVDLDSTLLVEFTTADD
jgi:hypothetical protein